MLVSPLPGVKGDELLHQLRDLSTQVGNLNSIGAGSPDRTARRLWAYLEWAGNAAHLLSRYVSAADVDRLVLTSRYQILMGTAADLVRVSGGNDPERLLNTLVSAELSDRALAFDRASRELAEQIACWRRFSWFVMLDTCVFIEHEHKLEELDIADILGAGADPIYLIIPMVVVDELDAAKRNHKKRWRAAYSLAVVDRVVREGGLLRAATSAEDELNPEIEVRGPVTLDVVSDVPQHVRLPSNDEEIIDRALAVEALADSPVTLVTFDTGMSLRAREAGLTEIKLDWPTEPVSGR